MSKGSMILVSLTKTSAGGGALDLIAITLSSRGFLCSWLEEPISLPGRPKMGGSLVFGGNTDELIGDVGRASVRRVFFFGGGPGLPSLSLDRLIDRLGVELSK